MEGDCEFDRIGLLTRPLEEKEWHPGTLKRISPAYAIQHNAVVKVI
jgi:hypothetical protein